MFSVASNFDDELPVRLAEFPVTELFGAVDDSPLGHGRPHAAVAPVSWRQLARHVGQCRRHDMGFNLLLNPLCLSGRELSLRLERRIRATLRRAESIGATAVTVAHPWVLSLACETKLRKRASVFTGIATVEAAQHWAGAGADVLCLDSHALSRDLPLIEKIARRCRAEIELPVNIGCLLRCPVARNHACRLAHASQPGVQPFDPFYAWCHGEKAKSPYHLVRSDFIRPEDLHRYEAAGVRHFKIVDRTCSTEALVDRVRAYTLRQWSGNLLELLGKNGSPPRRRRLPVFSALRHLGLRGALRRMREGKNLMHGVAASLPWFVDNEKLRDLLLPNGCPATHCAECGHCARVARLAVRPI